MGICASEEVEQPVNPAQVDLSHFVMMKVVGKGGFGKVNAVQKRYGNKEILAMKRMNKRKLLAKEAHLATVWRERDIMIQLRSPFLVNIHHAFQTKDELILIMPFMQGGDLRFYLNECGSMNESTCAFYAAEILLGMESLHSLKILYRDLKPDNVLFDDEGHLRISDFGLAVQLKADNNFRATGGAGTPGYMAPEVLDEDEYGLSADVWTYGVTLFELLHKARPYSSEEEEYSHDTLQWRKDISPEAKSLILGILNKDVSQRLGCGPGGWNEIKKHAFFKKIDWTAIANRDIKPPHQPDVSKANCVADYELEDQFNSDHKEPELTVEQQDKFADYEYNLKPNLNSDANKPAKHADERKHD